MATLVLQAAGVLLGGLLGPVGAAIGSAAGALGGYLVDRALISSTQHQRGPRLQSMRPFTGEEGAAIPRVFGTVRVGGTLIWATRFEETSTSRRQGFKGGPKVTTYSYFANAAFALCEGPIAGVRRVWADGREVDLTLVDIRIHSGAEDQLADPLVEAKQGAGNAPAYRGTAYAVIDRFPIDEYGNRLPQFQFEVLKPAGDLASRAQAVALIPGSTEYGLATESVTRSRRRGETEALNRHVLYAGTDIDASLDELHALCPNLKNVALVVTWFGDDLRAGACRIRPALPASEAATYSRAWTVSGVTRATAPAVSETGSGAAYGGTPSDRSVIQAISAIHARGWSVTLYPFVMMDIPAGNGRPDPYGGAEQAAHPWRGRITCYPGPGVPESVDVTSAARSQVEAFAGEAAIAEFTAGDQTIGFAGSPDEYGYRRMVLHYAHLAVLAGGVDGFLIGSELRGLTTLRDGANAFPFVEALVDLAIDLRAVLGPETRLTYGADWSEYFGHHPADGSGDVFFHLDSLWAHPAIDAVGIDNYMPLSDWRDEDHAGGNPDGYGGPYDRDGLRDSIGAGEGFDWYYADAEARAARVRSPIIDELAGKPWVFRYKDIHAWWDNEHFDRVGGVESGSPTAWTPRGKPIWLTELGCAAVDKGPNQPNVFPDPKSSENAIPYFSNGGRSDLAQRRFIEAHLDHWDPSSSHFEASDNPGSDVYDGRMLDPERIYLWAWDARPFPAFPMGRDIWSDSENWLRGHWLNGRLAGVEVADIVAELIGEHGEIEVDVRGADGFVQGYAVDEPMPTRTALEPLIELFGLNAAENGEALVLESLAADEAAVIDEIVVPDDEPALRRQRGAEMDVPGEVELTFRDPMTVYQAGQVRVLAGNGERVSLGFPGTIEAAQAGALADDWLARARAGRETIGFVVPASERRPAPGRVLQLPSLGESEWLVTAVEDGLSRTVEARLIDRRAPAPDRARLPGSTAADANIVGPPFAILMDLPSIGEGPPEDQLRLAVLARPWRTQHVYASPEATGFDLRGGAATAATVGQLVSPLGAGVEGRLDHGGFIDVLLPDGELASVTLLQMLKGANIAAIRSDAGAWEIVQFADAEETAPSVWRLGTLLRGQVGTGDAAAAGAAEGADFVLLDGTVLPAGLRASEIGLPLNWRIGPAGHDLSDLTFVSETVTGGVRALTPLSPARLRAEAKADGSIEVSWIRRSRIGSDTWLGPEIPLGEASEAYSIDIVAGGETIRSETSGEPAWTYDAESVAADFPEPPASFDIVVSQISAAVGSGLPSRITLSI